MTVIEFYEEYCRSSLKIKSAYNGKVLCKDFNPEKHIEVGKREITTVWAEIETSKPRGFGNISRPIMCAFVDGAIEYNKEHVKG